MKYRTLSPWNPKYLQTIVAYIVKDQHFMDYNKSLDYIKDWFYFYLYKTSDTNKKSTKIGPLVDNRYTGYLKNKT